MDNQLSFSDEFLFVYGTLRKATSMHSLLENYCQYIENGFMQGRLYEVKQYPGVVESDNPNDIVSGELYRIGNQEKLLPLLDEYEQCTDRFSEPHEYIRKQFLISTSAGEKVIAWVYVYNLDVSRLSLIESGDYLNR